MRILMLVNEYWPKVGGAEHQAGLLARNLKDRGIQVRVITLQLDPSHPLAEEVDGVPVLRISYPRIRLFGTVFMLSRVFWELIKARASYDLIHVHMVEYFALVAMAVRYMTKKPVILKPSVIGSAL